MCLLLHMRPGAEPLTRTEVQDFYAHSHDGFGAIWRDQAGVIRTMREMYGIKKQWRFVQSIEGCEALLHWRYATNAARGRENCHPFHVANGVYLMHNGVLSLPATKTESDTRRFAAMLGNMLRASPDALTDPTVQTALRDQCRFSSNKLVFWGGAIAEPLFFGGGGTTHKGRWYSNEYAWSSPYANWEIALVTPRHKPRAQKGFHVYDYSLPTAHHDTVLWQAKDALDSRLAWCSTAQAVYDAIEDISCRYGGDDTISVVVLAEKLYEYADEEAMVSILEGDNGNGS